MIYIFIIIFILSFFIALWSMKDFKLPSEFKNFLLTRKIKGTIVFLKDKIIHFHHHSSSFSSASSEGKGR